VPALSRRPSCAIGRPALCLAAVKTRLERAGNRQKPRSRAEVGAPIRESASVVGGTQKVLDFRILGRLEVVEGDRPLVLGGPKQRALLVVLLLHRGETVSTDRLIDELWGERPPATAAKTAQVYVSNLRKVLGDGVVVTRGRGYELAIESGQVDLDRFRVLVSEGRRALQAGDPREARGRLGEALALWRGPPLTDFEHEPFAQGEAARLEEERLAALEDRIEADLASGNHAALVGELESLGRQHPLRERLHEQQMLALYRSGRQVDALERYQQTRRELVEQLGIEPGPALRELERAILAHDPALQRHSSGSPRMGGLSRRSALAIAAGVLLLLLVVIAAPLTIDHRGRGASTIVSRQTGAVVAIDPADYRILAGVEVGRSPGDIALGGGSIWVLDAQDQTISEVDPRTRRTVHTLSAGADAERLAYGGGSLWVGSNASFRTERGNILLHLLNPDLSDLEKINPSTSTLPTTVTKLPIVAQNTVYDEGNDAVWARKLAADDGAVWVASSTGSVYHIDPGSGRIIATVHGLHSGSVALDPTGVWALGADGDRGYLSLISSRTNGVTTHITVPSANIGGATVGYGALWFTGHDQGARGAISGVGQESLWRVRVGDTTRVNLGLGPGAPGIALGAGSVWVINATANTVIRVDPVTLRTLKVIKLRGIPRDIAFDEGVIWVSVA
jgi:DNA-binding SARP family transcriptional activator